MGFQDRIRRAWNAFRNRDPTEITYDSWRSGPSTSQKPDRVRLHYGNQKSIVSAVFNRIAVDVSSIPLQHVRKDQNEKYVETLKSPLNECLTVSANCDQTGKDFIRDAVTSMLDEGCVALVPIDTSTDTFESGSFDIYSMRVGEILEWFPKHIKVRAYNENSGQKEEIIVEKRTTVIIENPMYMVMNQPNSTLPRLIEKLNLLDQVDRASSSGKMDLIIRLPYTIKSPTKRAEAEKRRKDIEMQLTDSAYGIAYIDGTESVTQLNRPVENNLLGQIEYLTKLLFSQLGMSETIFDGTADEKTMLNYFNRTIEPILTSIVEGIQWKWLTMTARTQHQGIMYFRDPFKLVPVNQIADIADKFTRNEILSSNEMRSVIGYKPVDDPKADELRNKNLNNTNQQTSPSVTNEDVAVVEGDNTNGS